MICCSILFHLFRFFNKKDVSHQANSSLTLITLWITTNECIIPRYFFRRHSSCQICFLYMLYPIRFDEYNIYGLPVSSNFCKCFFINTRKFKLFLSMTIFNAIKKNLTEGYNKGLFLLTTYLVLDVVLDYDFE